MTTTKTTTKNNNKKQKQKLNKTSIHERKTMGSKSKTYYKL